MKMQRMWLGSKPRKRTDRRQKKKRELRKQLDEINKKDQKSNADRKRNAKRSKGKAKSSGACNMPDSPQKQNGPMDKFVEKTFKGKFEKLPFTTTSKDDLDVDINGYRKTG